MSTATDELLYGRAMQDGEEGYGLDVAGSHRWSVEASVPPAGWNGTLCEGCICPRFCRLLGPRGPNSPAGPCAAWPEASRDDGAHHVLANSSLPGGGITASKLNTYERAGYP